MRNYLILIENGSESASLCDRDLQSEILQVLKKTSPGLRFCVSFDTREQPPSFFQQLVTHKSRYYSKSFSLITILCAKIHKILRKESIFCMCLYWVVKKAEMHQSKYTQFLLKFHYLLNTVKSKDETIHEATAYVCYQLLKR